MQTRAKWANDEGGIKIGDITYNIEIVTWDTQDNTTRAREGMEKMVQEGATHPLLPRIQKWNDQVRENPADVTAVSEKESSKTTRSNIDSKSHEGDARNNFLHEVKLLLSAPEISWDDNFFDIGGDSLLATALQVRLKNSDQWRPPRLDEIFRSQNFNDLYERISQT